MLSVGNRQITAIRLPRLSAADFVTHPQTNTTPYLPSQTKEMRDPRLLTVNVGCLQYTPLCSSVTTGWLLRPVAPTGSVPDKERKGQRGSRPEEVTGAPDGCVTPLHVCNEKEIRYVSIIIYAGVCGKILANLGSQPRC